MFRRYSPFEPLFFPRLSMNTRLMGFDDPVEDLEREFSRDPLADFDHLVSNLIPQLGLPPLRVTDSAQVDGAPSAIKASPARSEIKQPQAAAGGDQKQLQVQQPQQQQLASMDVDTPQRQWLTAYSRAPAIDVVEREKDFQVNVDVPGVNKEDLKLQITEDRRGRKLLTVSGERKEEQSQEDKQRGYRSMHRLYGQFSRSLRLPESCDTSSAVVQAKHENGVLKITLPKQNPEAAKPQGVDIKID